LVIDIFVMVLEGELFAPYYMFVCMICCHRREVELMYDNAMQAMIRKKEEEFAQLQVMASFLILFKDVLILGPGGSLLYVVVLPIWSSDFDY
jgi:hypothetical protein